MSKFLRLCVLGFASIAWALSFNTAYGENDYQIETSAQYFLQDDDDLKLEQYGLGATIYLNPVDVGGHPLAEAWFLERAASVSLSGAFTVDDYGDDFEGDGSSWQAQVICAEPEKPVYVHLVVSMSDSDLDGQVEGETSGAGFDLGIGAFLKDGLLVGLAYKHYESSYLIDYFWPYDIEHDEYGAYVKWVHEMGGGTAVNVETYIGLDYFEYKFDTGLILLGYFLEPDDESVDGSNSIIQIAGDYYFNPRISIGAGFSLNSGDYKYDEGQTFMARAAVFATPHFGVAVDFQKFFADDHDIEDTRSVGLVLLGRF